MVRTQIYLTKEEKAGLESVALAQGKKQSDIIRKAVDDLLARQGTINKPEILDEIAGIWATRKDLPDVRKMRTGWRRRPLR
jgi:Ribbon-helix-helix protein, copG family